MVKSIYPYYQVAEIVGRPQSIGQSSYKFRIIEVYWSCDGPRSRLTSQTFSTREEADTRCAELERHD